MGIIIRKMKYHFLIYFLLVLSSCSLLAEVKSPFLNMESEEVIELYMKKYPEIDNPCYEKPYYKVNFIQKDSINGFWVAAHLGQPGSVAPLKPGTPINENPKELKGGIKIKVISSLYMI